MKFIKIPQQKTYIRNNFEKSLETSTVKEFLIKNK